MESLQQQYWAQYEEAGELFMHGSIEDGLTLCLDLRRQVKMGLYLRAMVNAALAIFSENAVDKSEYATECLDLSNMLHKQAPDDETAWLVKHAENLMSKTSSSHIEIEEDQDLKDDPGIVTECFGSPTEVDKPSISWEGMFTNHWKAAKRSQQD
ncbi:hypothetical protein LTR84_001058 [Exophiala bonariae]|uniref:Uncharacterized protein n=1 Tax=Exophiala bonariae TaxID=1690606 RepID=A0AAV9NTB2_9EURO|nr:hypothetical protein LTR84_001058 [Exophiala bonariae]